MSLKFWQFPDVLEEGKVEVLVLEPGQLEVAVDVGAVRVPGQQIIIKLAVHS